MIILLEAENEVNKLRYSVSNVKQGSHNFYTLTMPSDVLARTCKVSSRSEDPKVGFQRSLDKKRASEIAEYIDRDFGTIPNSIILSAQKEANLEIVGRGKTLQFDDVPGAFLILDGQHRVYGFHLAETSLRVPVVIYNGLTRTDETRLFIDINTKQKPVPAPLLLDIKRLAEIETDEEVKLRDIFDEFHSNPSSVLKGFTSPAEASKSRLTRVSFNHGVKPLMDAFEQRDPEEIYKILNSYLAVFDHHSYEKTTEKVISKPVVFRALMAFFPSVATRVKDKHGGRYSEANFDEIIAPIFQNMQIKRLVKPGTSWINLAKYLEDRAKNKQAF